MRLKRFVCRREEENGERGGANGLRKMGWRQAVV
jgi:hypothetical protein